MIRNAYLLEKIANFRVFRTARNIGGKITEVAEHTGAGMRATRVAARDAASGDALMVTRKLKEHLAGELMTRDPNLTHGAAYRMADKVLEERLKSAVGAGASGTVDVGGKAVGKFSLRNLGVHSDNLHPEQVAANEAVIKHLQKGDNVEDLAKKMTDDKINGKSIFDTQRVTGYTTGADGKLTPQTSNLFSTAADKTEMKGADIGKKLFKNDDYQKAMVENVEKTTEAAEKANKYKTKGELKKSKDGKDGGDYMWPALLGGGAAVGGGYLLTRPSGSKRDDV